MSDTMRWLSGDKNCVEPAVDADTVIEIGDLLWQDVDDAKPASEIPKWESGGEAQQKRFADNFLGVAMQRSRNGDTIPIKVATTGVFEFNCKLRRWELGNRVGAIPNYTGRLQDQAVGGVADEEAAIGRVAQPEHNATASVCVAIRSAVIA